MLSPKFLLSFLLILLSAQVIAQPVGSVTCTVTERNTLRPVAGATVQLLNGPSGITDSAGRFSFTQVAVGSYTLTVSSVAYKQAELFNLIITSGNEVSVNIELETIAQELAG